MKLSFIFASELFIYTKKNQPMQSLKINLTELTFQTLKNVFSEKYQIVSFTRMQQDGKEGNVYKDAIFAPSIYAGQRTEIRDEKDFDHFKKSHLKKKDDLILSLPILRNFCWHWTLVAKKNNV